MRAMPDERYNAGSPRAGVPTPVPEWKRGPLAEGVLPAGDPAAPAADA
jgi:hypothetical protein